MLKRIEDDKNNKKIKKIKEKRVWPYVLLIVFFILTASAGGGLYAGYLYFSYDLPKLDKLSDYNPKSVTRFYADDGTVIAEFFEERREIVPLQRMPQNLIDAFVAAEDSKFFLHPGVDLWAILRATIRNLKAGRIVQGGSTITQQVCKSFLLTPEKSYRRKIREAILAYKIDRRFTKNEILYLYLNQIYLGQGAYGVEAASQVYYDKSVENLTLAECAMLAGLLPAPSRYSPRTNPEGARERQIYVLNRMVEERYVTVEEAQEAADEKVNIVAKPRRVKTKAPYFVEHVRLLIEEKYGSRALMEEGLKIYTTVDLAAQESAERAVRNGLLELDKRIGYRGPIARIKPKDIKEYLKKLAVVNGPEKLVANQTLAGVVVSTSSEHAVVHLGHARAKLSLEKMQWARRPNADIPYYQARAVDVGQVLKTGDVILVKLLSRKGKDSWAVALEQEPSAQSALVSMKAENGHIVALVGGQDWSESQFNRATQAKRQPGSAFKPLIYAAALDNNYTASSILLDAPVVYKLPGNPKPWKPRNFSEKFYGPTTLRVALEKSRNVIAVKLLDELGIESVIEYAKKLGTTSQLIPNLSLALGSSEMTVLETVEVYSAFCNGGIRNEPIFIKRVEDRNGKVLEESALKQTRVISPATSYILTHLMRGVVQNGTGWRLKALKRPVAGKTGTTDDNRDAWFVGYTPGYITSVWVGHDDHSRLGKGETGSRSASPIWLGFMQEILDNTPVRDFSVPDGVQFARVDKKTGLLAEPDEEAAIIECFKAGTVPEKTKAQTEKAGTQDFLMREVDGI